MDLTETGADREREDRRGAETGDASLPVAGQAGASAPSTPPVSDGDPPAVRGSRGEEHADLRRSGVPGGGVKRGSAIPAATVRVGARRKKQGDDRRGVLVAHRMLQGRVAGGLRIGIGAGVEQHADDGGIVGARSVGQRPV